MMLVIILNCSNFLLLPINFIGMSMMHVTLRWLCAKLIAMNPEKKNENLSYTSIMSNKISKSCQEVYNFSLLLRQFHYLGIHFVRVCQQFDVWHNLNYSWHLLCLKIFSPVCSVFLIRYVYHIMINFQEYCFIFCVAIIIALVWSFNTQCPTRSRRPLLKFVQEGGCSCHHKRR